MTIQGKRTRRHHKWTEAEREILHLEYEYTEESAKQLATKLTRLAGEEITLKAVLGQLDSQGYRRPRRRWLPSEDEQLARLLGEYSSVTVSRMMNRTVSSVIVRAHRMGFSRRAKTGWYNAREVAYIFGVGSHWVERRINLGVLRADRRGPTYHIAEEDLVAFIRKYPQELVGRNIDLVVIVDLLAGLNSA